MSFSEVTDLPPGTKRPEAKPGLTRMQANGLMLLAALAWGLGNVSQKTILDHLDAFTANGLTCLIGAVVLYPLARREGQSSLPPVHGSGLLLAMVAVAFTVASTLMQMGYGHTTVTNAGFLVNTAAVITPILAWVFLRQRPTLMVWLACGIALFGVFLMGGGGLSALAYGDLLSLAAALAFAVWTLLVGAYVMRYRRPARLTVVQLGLCGIICMVMGALIHGLPPPAALRAALPEILFLGLISKGVAYMLMATAQQHVPPTCAAVLVSAESVFGALAAMVFLAETPGLVRAVGGLCIIAGVIIAARIPAAGPPAQQS